MLSSASLSQAKLKGSENTARLREEFSCAVSLALARLSGVGLWWLSGVETTKVLKVTLIFTLCKPMQLIMFFIDQCEYLCTAPALNLLFSAKGLLHSIKFFKIK